MLFTRLEERSINRTERFFVKLNEFELTKSILLFDRSIELKVPISPKLPGTRLIDDDPRMVKSFSGTPLEAKASIILSATWLVRSVVPLKTSVFNLGNEEAGKFSKELSKPELSMKDNCSANINRGRELKECIPVTFVNRMFDIWTKVRRNDQFSWSTSHSVMESS